MNEAFCLNRTQRDELEHCYSGLDEEQRATPCRILGLDPYSYPNHNLYFLLRAAIRGELAKLLGSLVKDAPKGTEVQLK